MENAQHSAEGETQQLLSRKQFLVAAGTGLAWLLLGGLMPGAKQSYTAQSPYGNNTYGSRKA